MSVEDRGGAMLHLVDRLNDRVGCGFRLIGLAELGETAGAAFVEWPDGRQGVVTVATVPAAVMRRTAVILALVRAQGLPVPRLELVVELEDLVAVVQERLPGRHPDPVSAEVIDTIVAANDRFADWCADQPDMEVPTLVPARSGTRCSQTRTLQQYSDRSRRLLRRTGAVAGQQPREMREGRDLVHPDLTVSNVLIDNGHVTGVIDWNNGALRGDRRFALVKLLFDLTWEAAGPAGGRHHVQPSGLARLKEILHDTVDADLLRVYWAHWTITMLDWTIRSGDTGAIELHLRLGEEGLS